MLRISTHTLARRVTYWKINASPLSLISTHTLARRVTKRKIDSVEEELFQPTPSHGG